MNRIENIALSAGRFVLVGALATLAHIIITVALVEFVSLHPSAANGLAYLVANVLSYLINTKWSFQSRYSNATWSRFILVSILTGSLTVAIAWVVDYMGGHYLIGLIMIITIVSTVSFIAHRRFTYRCL